MQLAANPPSIMTPGRGPNGPGPIDMRPPVASVGIGSCPYGPTNGYAASNTGVTGFVGPSADALRRPTSWYVRVGGSNNNGGSSSSLTAERTGTDGVMSALTATFTSATGAFTGADIGKGVCVGTGTAAFRFRIVGIVSSTVVNVDRQCPSNLAAQTWALGGAWADLRAVVGDIAVSQNTTGAASAVNSGDVVYVGAGTYRQVIAVSGVQWSRVNNQGVGINQQYPEFNGVLNVVGDVDGSHTGDAGMVQFTGYTTNDKTAASGTTLLNLNGKSNIAFSNIMFMQGNSVGVACAAAQNITFTDCSFASGHNGGTANALISITSVALCKSNLLLDRCIISRLIPQSGGNTLAISATRAVSDYDMYILVRNTMFNGHGGQFAVNIAATGAGAGFGGGVRVTSCSVIAGAGMATTTGGSTVFPNTIYGCLLAQGNNQALNAQASGQIIEGYNLFVSVTPRTNVAAGTHSISDGSYSPLWHFGQERIWGGLSRPFGEPMSGSPLLGFGAQDPIASNPLDLRGFPRPAGGASPLATAGALERWNTAAQGTTPAPASGTYNWKGTGAWAQDFLVPVDTSATTIACAVQRDSAYAGALPVIELLANPTLGVTAQSVADTGAAGANNTITLAPFTASANGAVTVRVRSRDLTGTSVVAFSVFTIA